MNELSTVVFGVLISTIMSEFITVMAIMDYHLVKHLGRKYLWLYIIIVIVQVTLPIVALRISAPYIF